MVTCKQSSKEVRGGGRVAVDLPCIAGGGILQGGDNKG